MDATSVNAIIAAVAALAGAGLAQLGTGLLRRGDRKQDRNFKRGDLQRSAVDSCRVAALALKETLSDSTRSPLELTNAKSRFEAETARIHDAATRKSLEQWSKAAVDRAQGLLGAEDEDKKWKLAATNLGQLWRSSDQ